MNNAIELGHLRITVLIRYYAISVQPYFHVPELSWFQNCDRTFQHEPTYSHVSTLVSQILTRKIE